jgi:hypothetical protein
LEKALIAIPDVTTAKVEPENFSAANQADLIIFDNVSVNEISAGNYIFINRLPRIDGFFEIGKEEYPVIYDWKDEHPILRFVELRDVNIQRAIRTKLPDASLVLVESEISPLIALYSSEGINLLLFNFDLYDSTLPLRASFPILISNCIEFLEKERIGESGTFLRTGTVAKIAAPKDVETVNVIDPSGRGWTVMRNPRGELLFDKTRQAGFYRVEVDGKPSGLIGVSLLDAKESDLQTSNKILLPGREITASSGVKKTNREVWRWFALAALLLVMLEWLVYHRRVLV